MTPGRARAILVCAIVLGIVGDQFLRSWPWGLGFVGFVALGVLAAFATGWDRPFGFDGSRPSRERLAVLVATFLAALGVLLRDAGTLQFYNSVAFLGFAALTVWLARGRSITRFRIRDGISAWWATATSAGFGLPVLLFSDAEWGGPGRILDRRAKTLLLGCLFAAPPVLLVAGLLGDADPVFADFLASWRRLGIEQLVQHTVVAGVIAWPMAGWLRGITRPVLEPMQTGISVASRLDFIGVAPALYAVAGLLAAFLGLQARALFGGPAYVEDTTGLTYAEYARQGFFQLVAVTAVVLGLLIVGDWVLKRGRPEDGKRFRAVGWVTLLLLGILMASALQRMWVYVSFYGLSDTRLYATAGMVWVGMALGLFGWTILRGHRARFGIGLLVASAGWIAALDAINPEAVVVRVNLARALAGHDFDVIYHASFLSADAVPALMRAAEQLPVATCLDIVDHLGSRDAYHTDDTRDWRSWTVPLAAARAYFPELGVTRAERDHCGRAREATDPPMSVPPASPVD